MPYDQETKFPFVGSSESLRDFTDWITVSILRVTNKFVISSMLHEFEMINHGIVWRWRKINVYDEYIKRLYFEGHVNNSNSLNILLENIANYTTTYHCT